MKTIAISIEFFGPRYDMVNAHFDNCIMLYIYLYFYLSLSIMPHHANVIAAALSCTKRNRSLDDSVARGSISVVHDTVTELSNSITPKEQQYKSGCVHICTYKCK